MNTPGFVRAVATAADKIRGWFCKAMPAQSFKRKHRAAMAPAVVLPLQYDHLPECESNAVFRLVVAPEALRPGAALPLETRSPDEARTSELRRRRDAESESNAGVRAVDLPERRAASHKRRT